MRFSQLRTFARANRPLMLILSVSVMARILSALYQGNSIQPLPGVTDQISYHELAIRVLNGFGFSFGTGWWPSTRANEPTAHWSFLYVLYLSAVYAVVGVMPLAARLLQAVVVGVLHPLLVWRLGSRIFGPAAGLAAAAFTAVYGYFVFYAGALVTESLYFLAFLWVMDLATALVATPSARVSPRLWAWLGLAIGAAALLRQAVLLVVPVVLLWLAWELRKLRVAAPAEPRVPLVRRMALTIAVAAACILPWTARNYAAFGQFVLLNTNAGYVFFYGAHPVHGTTFIPIMAGGSASYQALMPRDIRRMSEAQIERVLLRRGLGFVRDDPWRYARLSLSRVGEFVKFWPTSDSGRFSNLVRLLSFGLLLPLVIVGIGLSLRRPVEGESYPSGATLLLLVSVAYAVVHFITWTLVRYRLPLDALVMPFAGLAIATVVAKIQSRVPAPHASLETLAP